MRVSPAEPCEMRGCQHRRAEKRCVKRGSAPRICLHSNPPSPVHDSWLTLRGCTIPEKHQSIATTATSGLQIPGHKEVWTGPPANTTKSKWLIFLQPLELWYRSARAACRCRRQFTKEPTTKGARQTMCGMLLITNCFPIGQLAHY